MKRPPKMLTVREVAERLGVKASRVREWIHGGQLVAVNVASDVSKVPRFRVAPDALATFEKSRTVSAAPKQPKSYRSCKRAGFIEYI